MVVGDALEQGLVPSLARPGGNLTGISAMPTELSQRQLEILREALPQIRRVAVLWCPDLAGNPPQWREIQSGAAKLGLQLQSLEVCSPDDFDPALRPRLGTSPRPSSWLSVLSLFLQESASSPSQVNIDCQRSTGEKGQWL